jgi:hypothetical protein
LIDRLTLAATVPPDALQLGLLDRGISFISILFDFGLFVKLFQFLHHKL